MRLVTEDDYLSFRAHNQYAQIDNVRIPLRGPFSPATEHPPEDYTPETDTVWSFPDRGTWATHSGNYRGNWSPYIPRNLILRFTEPGDTVLDQMVGSGTTLIECKLLGRNGIGVDINEQAIIVARDRLSFATSNDSGRVGISTYVGDARSLDALDDMSVDLVATHPPYAGIISYSAKGGAAGDLSSLGLEEYVDAMREVAKEAYRVLRPGKHCAILIGDTRKHLHYVPISVRVLLTFLDVGFLLREEIIKRQWKTKTTRERWRGKAYPFYKIAHEHLYIFRKPGVGESVSAFKFSRKWWKGP